MLPTSGEWPNHHRLLGVRNKSFYFENKNMGGQKIGGGNKKIVKRLFFIFFGMPLFRVGGVENHKIKKLL